MVTIYSGLILDQLTKVEEKTEALMKQFPSYSSQSSTACTSAPSWEGFFASLFQGGSTTNTTSRATAYLGGATRAGGQQPPNNQNSTNSDFFEIMRKLQQ